VRGFPIDAVDLREMPPVLAIVGPTAVGKTEIGLGLAEWAHGEIVSADSLQAYRGFDIGTAKPTSEQKARVPHHLIDILDPDEEFSAGEFARRADVVITEIQSRGRLPIVIGGSGFYLRALLDGLSAIPSVRPGVREELRQRLERQGLEELREELRNLDPLTEARLAPGDTQRVLRALEVAISTGRTLSAWHADSVVAQPSHESVRIGLTVERGLLYDRIAHRVHRMIEAGWVREVEELLHRGLSPRDPAFQAIGYRELAAHLAGEVSLEEAIEETIRATRRFAKRQLTWFRKERDIKWFSAEDLDAAGQAIRSFLAGQELGVGDDQVDNQHSGRVPVSGSQSQQAGVGSADDR
jgi:tRNA dimethylallyltransferase